MPPQLRPMVSVVLGGVAGALVHRAVVESTGREPVGWRVVSQVDRESATPIWGPRRIPGSWLLERQTAWFARTSLPGQRLRTIDLTTTLPERGQLDMWLSRRAIDLPAAGDLLLRLDRFEAGSIRGRVYTWGTDGPHRVSCSPGLSPDEGVELKVQAKLDDGLLEVRLGDQSSVCAVLAGTDPPALQSGHHRVLLSDLQVDGRPVHAPHPGAGWMWALFGAFASLGAGRLERATGAGLSVSLLGDLGLLSSAGLALLLARRLPDADPSIVLCIVGFGVLARVSMHLGRALRPGAPTGDWTRTAAIAAILPALGLLFLARPDLDAHLPFGAYILGTSIGAVGLVLMLSGLRRKWRTVALIGALVSAAALLGAVVGGSSLAAIGAATLAGGGLALAATGLTRVPPSLWRQAVTVGAGLLSMFCALEVSTASLHDIEPPLAGEPSRTRLIAPVAALPAVPEDGLLFVGPFAPGSGGGPQTSARVLHAQLRRPVHRVGDNRWGLSELLQSLRMSGSGIQAGAVVLTAGAQSDVRLRGASPRNPHRGERPFFGTLALAQQLFRSPEMSLERLVRDLRELRTGLSEHGVPLLVVLGPSGPDPAPLDDWREAIQRLDETGSPTACFDLGAMAHASDDPVWLDGRGHPSEHAWTELAEQLRPMLSPSP